MCIRDSSGTGVAFTRDPATGAKKLMGGVTGECNAGAGTVAGVAECHLLQDVYKRQASSLVDPNKSNHLISTISLVILIFGLFDNASMPILKALSLIHI